MLLIFSLPRGALKGFPPHPWGWGSSGITFLFETQSPGLFLARQMCPAGDTENLALTPGEADSGDKQIQRHPPPGLKLESAQSVLYTPVRVTMGKHNSPTRRFILVDECISLGYSEF